MTDPHEILLYPIVTEKSLNFLSGTAAQGFKDGNKLEFVVKRSATRVEIRAAFEKFFEAKVEKVNTHIKRDGKHAIIQLKEGYSAEEIGMRIGIF
ncbi:MAG: 50S ribosomal protein L23 [Candidatus Thermoplasmatota archaeon]|nr:50S ribosomal protein L23 [Candidatus Thermoplasmatota archaeon]